MPPPRPPKPPVESYERPDIIPERPPPLAPRSPKQASASQQQPGYQTSVPVQKPVIVDNLLNLGEDQSQFDDIKSNDISQRKDVDLLADLFSSSGSVTDSKQDSAVPPHSIPAVNLFGDVAQNKNNVKSAAPNTVTNANLLDDLFGPGPSMTVGQEPIPPSNVAANQSSNMMPTSSSFTSLFLGGNFKQDEMKKNVSSPNLTQLIGNGSAGGNLGLGLDFDLDLANLTSQKADTRTSGTANQKMEAKPNYSRSLFEDKPEPQQKPNLNSVFGEFLNDVGFTATSNKLTNQTMNELRMETNAKELDPITIQIRKWTNDGQKRKNIRALLSTLHTVTWPSCSWQEHPMSQMIQPTQVKKVYRKACLCIHPDKQVGTEWEELAKSIFIELNEAWSYFSQEEQM